jgi:hypothetical protein
MLEESKLRQNEILFVENPEDGLGYQAIAALQRLGIKCQVRDSSNLLNIKPLQVLASKDPQTPTSGATGFLKAPLRALQNQEPLSPEEVCQITNELAEIPSTAHGVVLLPYTAKPQNIKVILSSHERTTVILCPRLIGFRDANFFQTLVSALRRQDGVTWQTLKSTQPYTAIPISDVCGFLISAIWNKTLFQKILVCPELSIDPQAIIVELENELEFKPNFFEKLKANLKHKFSKPKTEISCSQNTPAIDYATLLATTPNAIPLLAELPTSTTPIHIWVKKTAAQLEREPHSDLHFPPARAP